MQACYLLVSTRMLWRSFLHGHMMSLLSPYLRWMLVIVTGTLLVFLHNAVCQIRKQYLWCVSSCIHFKLYQAGCL